MHFQTLPVRMLKWGVPALMLLALQLAHSADGSKIFKNQCAACHGVTGSGNSAMHAPPLAGIDADYVARQLHNFRSGMRGDGAPGSPGVTMQAMARTLPDDQAVQDVASYIGTLKPTAKKGEVTPPGSPRNAGKALFAVCVACHGGQGEGRPSLGAPRLTHLPGWYLSSQLLAYRDGGRGDQPDDKFGQQMRQVTTELLVDDQDIAAVIDYISSLGIGAPSTDKCPIKSGKSSKCQLKAE